MDAGRTFDPRGRSRDNLEVDDQDIATQRRLAHLVELNADIVRENAVFRTSRERHDATLMIRPLASKDAFAYFGLMLGSLPTLSIAFKLISKGISIDLIEALLPSLLVTAGLVTGLVGFLLGKLVPALVRSVADYTLPNRVAMIMLIGFGWGVISGALGGLCVVVIGSIAGGVIGGFVGAFVVPIFIHIHNSLRRGDLIERKHFLPVAFGITLCVCAFILGL